MDDVCPTDSTNAVDEQGYCLVWEQEYLEWYRTFGGGVGGTSRRRALVRGLRFGFCLGSWDFVIREWPVHPSIC